MGNRLKDTFVSYLPYLGDKGILVVCWAIDIFFQNTCLFTGRKDKGIRNDNYRGHSYFMDDVVFCTFSITVHL